MINEISKTNVKIRVHNPCNEHTIHNRFYNDFWDEFTEYLKKIFIVEEKRYFDCAHSGRMPVKLERGISENLLLLECEYIIENLENGEFVIMSVSDTITGAVIDERANPLLKKVLISQFWPSDINYYLSDYIEKYSPWTYFQSKKIDLEPFYQKRILTPPIDNKLYFKGVLDDRIILNYIDKDIMSSFVPMAMNQYLDDIIKYKIALSVDGRGELCYRDIECFAIGIPILRFEYLTPLSDPLIPNYHYISVSRPDDLLFYRLGNESHSKLLEQRYYEVLNDDNFLNFISKNAREYYLKNCTMSSIIKNTYNLLNLNNWV